MPLTKQTPKSAPRVMAIAAHPDDIEFMMAGTMLLLKQTGCELHYMNLSSGNCGSMTMSPSKTIRIRKAEAMNAAKILGATFHPSVAHDLEITYDLRLLRRLAAIVREVRPSILLTHSPQDYMEDHTNTCRLAVTAAFARGMPNFRSVPPRKAIESEVTIYHAMPHGLRDQLRNRIIPDFFINTESVHAQKRDALAAHASQKKWLDATQGMDSYLKVMDEMSIQLGQLSREFHHAEGWRRHSHWGFCEENNDPLKRSLKELLLEGENLQDDSH
jgi:LmbE family N-acetylglucosaminyl deacetylase